MDAHLKENQETNPFALDSVSHEKTTNRPKFSSASSVMSVAEEFDDGSLPFSDSESVGRLAVSPKPGCANGSSFNSGINAIGGKSFFAPLESTKNGSSLSPSLTTLAGQSCAPQSLNPIESSRKSVPILPTYGINSFDGNPEIEKNQEDRILSSSPLNLPNNSVMGYDSSSHKLSPWTSEWSSSSLTSSRWTSWSSSDEVKFDLVSSFSMQETKPLLVGAGLENLGNTCFMNAVLQCLTHTVPLVKGLRSCNHPMPCQNGSEGFCVLCALHEHIELSLTRSGGSVSPSKFADNLNYISSYFWRHQQEDAHEFLQCFLDKFETSLGSKDENLVKSVFGGALISRLKCCNCGHRSDTYESFVDLSLEIADVDTLSSALQSFTKVEEIKDSETTFTCDNCKEEVALEKQLMVDQAPLIAAFHLKRFKTYDRGVAKVNKHVQFPLELDLQFFTIYTGDDEEELKYDLYAIIVHEGISSDCGHYFCFIRSSPSTWHLMDDSEVSEVQEEYVLSQKAYILFYARRGTPWVSSLMEEQNMHLHQSLNAPVLDNNEGGFIPYSGMNNVSISDSNQSRVIEETSKAEVIESMIHETRDNASGVCGLNPCESKGISPQADDLEQAGASNCSDEKKCSTPCEIIDSQQQGINGDGCDDVFHLLTPPRSPSPDIMPSKSPVVTYQIPRGHLAVKNPVSGKRPLNKVADDLEKREAIRYITKSLPSSRGSKLISAIMGPATEGPLKKKKKPESTCLKVPSRASCKSNHDSTVQLPAAVLRSQF